MKSLHVPITTLILVLMAFSCTRQPPTSGKPEQTNSVHGQPAPKATSAPAKPSFAIAKVEVTRRPQKMGNGNAIAFSGDRVKPTLGRLKNGYSFVIVSFSLKVPVEQLSYNPQEDFVLSDATATYSEFMEDDVWMPYNSSIYKKGEYESKRLYLIPSKSIPNAKVHFLGEDYPIGPLLKTASK